MHLSQNVVTFLVLYNLVKLRKTVDCEYLCILRKLNYAEMRGSDYKNVINNYIIIII